MAAMATALRPVAPVARLRRGTNTAAPRKCLTQSARASRAISLRLAAYGDRRRNDDAPRVGGGWANQFGDEYDAIDADDGYFEEKPASRPPPAGRPERGKRFDDDRRSSGGGRAEYGDLRRRGEGGGRGGGGRGEGGRGRGRGRGDSQREDDGQWVEEVLPCSGRAPGRVIGKGGSTVNRIQEETGARIDIDRDSETCVVSGSPDAVAAAVAKCKLVMAEGDSAPGPWSDRGTARALRRDDDGTGEFMEEIVPCTGLGPGRVIGKRGATVTRLQEETGARIEVVADDGQCFISGTPTQVAAAVEAVTRIINDGDGYIPVGYDDNGEFGGFDPSRGRGGGREEQNDDWVEEIIPCRAPSAIGRIIGKGGSCVSQIEQECGVRIQVDKRMLECVVSGTPENVKLAVVKCLQVMEEGFGGAVLRVNCTGFEGAIIGPGGKRVRSIAGQTNARVDIEKIGYGESECVIKGSPDAVAAAETVVLQIIAEETANAGYGTASGGGGDRGGWNDRDDESLSFGDTPQRGGYDGLQDDRYDNRQSEYNETREAPRGGRGGGYGYGGGGGYDDKPRDDARGGYDDRGGYGGRGGGGGRGRGGGRGEGRGRESARTGGYDSGYGAPEQRVQYYDERVEGGDRFSGSGRGGGGEGGRGGSRGRGQSKGGSSRYSGGYAE